MKRIVFLFWGLAALCSCGGGLSDEGAGEGELKILLDLGNTKTVTPLDSEKTISALDIFVFNADGMLDISKTCTAAEIDARSCTVTLKTGVKTIWAVANISAGIRNMLNACTAMPDFCAAPWDMGHESPTNLVMVASETKTLTEGGATTTMSLGRKVSRVQLYSVKNSLPASYGALNVRCAFLCDCFGCTSVAGTPGASYWRNISGSKLAGSEGNYYDLAGNVMGYNNGPAESGVFTFKDLDESVSVGATKTWNPGVYFYTYPNARTTRNNGFPFSYTATATTLMVVANIAGTDYYYPVPMTDGLVENAQYAVALTISGFGNKAENAYDPITKGALTATIGIADWDSPASMISENI